MKTISVIQCNHIGWEGSPDVSLRIDPFGRRVIESVIERARRLQQSEATPIIACPDLPENRVFVELAAKAGSDVYFGDNDNVLHRLMSACARRGGERIAWFQGIHYFLHPSLMDRLLHWAEAGSFDYVRCPDASCKFMLGQAIRVDALKRALDLIERLPADQAAFFRARPLAFMRSRPGEFAIGLFEELPNYDAAELSSMREIAKSIYSEERAIHTEKGRRVGDISQGRYSNILHLIPETGTTLDIACGTGYGCRLLDNGRRRLVGVDISEEAVEFARQHNSAHARFMLGDAQRIPMDDASVDCVVSIGTIEHVGDASAFVREIRRVLVPGGRAVIYTPQSRIGQLPIWPWHTHEFSIEEIRSLVGAELAVDNILGWQNGTVTEDDPRGDGMFVVASRAA